ncbi:hypothetical protein LPC08_19915 [Roseomonas sp. OT10]|uniref:hypothetical protein n=1 Tax=Roseomonas cutis TaxID=2897332 RepID=UPI001E2908E3|nr:hypothetical protein [Roseomonas sp. OT10]UFN48257.1 hypothetical protein LPC08_19915 [Roseomonas sp. OT10]
MAYTDPGRDPVGVEARRRRALRWWWVALLLNLAAAGIAGLGFVLLPRTASAWLGLLPLATAPLVVLAPLLGHGRRRRTRHRSRPRGFSR